MRKFFKSIYSRVLIAVFIAAPLIVNILFKIDTGIFILQAEWSAGEALVYVASFMTTLGTMLLAYASFCSSEKSQEIANKLSEENNALQKVLAQNLYPTVNIRDIRVNEANQELRSEFDYNPIKEKTKSFIIGYKYSELYGGIKIDVNIDASDSSKPLLKKTMEFNIENRSDVLISHIAFSSLTLIGYKGVFEPLECKNIHSSDSGVSLLLSPDQTINVKMSIFYCDRTYEKAWEKQDMGLSIKIDITNTSITGISFKQYIIAEGTNFGLSRVYHVTRKNQV